MLGYFHFNHGCLHLFKHEQLFVGFSLWYITVLFYKIQNQATFLFKKKKKEEKWKKKKKNSLFNLYDAMALPTSPVGHKIWLERAILYTLLTKL